MSLRDVDALFFHRKFPKIFSLILPKSEVLFTIAVIFSHVHCANDAYLKLLSDRCERCGLAREKFGRGCLNRS